jgi:acyl-CoA thioester hydrolase
MKANQGVSEIEVRVNYSETDQMGVVYHAHYLIWLDRARTEHLRLTGTSYAALEAQGLRLAVGEARVRYRQAARYDDLVRIRCWVRELASRRITFGYSIHHADDDRLLATAETSMMVLDAAFRWSRLPSAVADRLAVVPDPVRL